MPGTDTASRVEALHRPALTPPIHRVITHGASNGRSRHPDSTAGTASAYPGKQKAQGFAPDPTKRLRLLELR